MNPNLIASFLVLTLLVTAVPSYALRQSTPTQGSGLEELSDALTPGAPAGGLEETPPVQTLQETIGSIQVETVPEGEERIPGGVVMPQKASLPEAIVRVRTTISVGGAEHLTLWHPEVPDRPAFWKQSVERHHRLVTLFQGNPNSTPEGLIADIRGVFSSTQPPAARPEPSRRAAGLEEEESSAALDPEERALRIEKKLILGQRVTEGEVVETLRDYHALVFDALVFGSLASAPWGKDQFLEFLDRTRNNPPRQPALLWRTVFNRLKKAEREKTRDGVERVFEAPPEKGGSNRRWTDTGVIAAIQLADEANRRAGKARYPLYPSAAARSGRLPQDQVGKALRDAHAVVEQRRLDGFRTWSVALREAGVDPNADHNRFDDIRISSGRGRARSQRSGLEEAKQEIDAAVARIRDKAPISHGYLADLTIHPVPGKKVRIEGEKISVGMDGEKNVAVLAQTLIWAGAAHRAIQTVSVHAEKISGTDPPQADQFRLLYRILQRAPVELHSSQKTTVYKGKIYLAVGPKTTLDRMKRDLVGAARELSQTEGGAAQRDVVGKALEDHVVTDFLREADRETQREWDDARAQGEALGDREAEKLEAEPQLDRDLLSEVKRYMEAHGVDLREAWPAYADRLNTLLKLRDRDRQIQFLEALFNVYGYIHYGERSAADFGVSQSGSALNIASETAEALASALVEYLNDPYLGQKGDSTRQGLLAEIAEGMAIQNLFAYLRFGHIPAYLARKISKPVVSAEIANEKRERQLAAAGTTSRLGLALKTSTAGLLTQAESGMLLLGGPAGQPSGVRSEPAAPSGYLPELSPDAGYQVGGSGLIDEIQKALRGAGSLEEAFEKISTECPGCVGNLRLALSRPDEQTPSGHDELSEVLLFYHYLGSVQSVQAVCRPLLKEIDLRSLSKEFSRSEGQILAGLFLWQVLHAFLKDQGDGTEVIFLNRLASLGTNRDGIFKFVEEFYRRFKAAAESGETVEIAAKDEFRASVLDAQRRRAGRRREEVVKDFATMGISLGGAPAGAPGNPAVSPFASAPTFEGFIFRLHQMDLGDEQVFLLNTNQEAAQDSVLRLVVADPEEIKSFRSAWKDLVGVVHADRQDHPLRGYIQGQVGGEGVAEFLYKFLLPFASFPEWGWWEKGKIGTALQQIQQALPDFEAAHAKAKAAEQAEMDRRLAAIERAVHQLTRRVASIEERLPPVSAPASDSAAGVEEPAVWTLDQLVTATAGDPTVHQLALDLETAGKAGVALLPAEVVDRRPIPQEPRQMIVYAHEAVAAQTLTLLPLTWKSTGRIYTLDRDPDRANAQLAGAAKAAEREGWTLVIGLDSQQKIDTLRLSEVRALKLLLDPRTMGHLNFNLRTVLAFTSRPGALMNVVLDLTSGSVRKVSAKFWKQDQYALDLAA
ncbi:MAG: hypothetical protein HYZ90_06400 [Candidatus Omnitrophica bacterium]|nr:hypothetical protein [Candidatus Omnitrophota bacterium]